MPNQPAARTSVMTPQPGTGPALAPVWPAGVPTETEADAILSAALGGLAAADDPALDATLVALTALEKEALEGVLESPDPAVIRGAATLRYRIATALATAPAASAGIDVDAGRALLGAIDGVLASLAALDARTRAPEQDAIRRALVKEAVDLSETLQRLTPHEAPAPAPAPRRAPTPVPRAVAVAVNPARHGGEPRRGVGAWIALAVVAALAGAYHLHAYLSQPPPTPQPTLPGLTQNAFGFEGVAGGPRMIASKDGAPLTPEEIAEFRRSEEAAGRVVRQVAPGIYVSAPSVQQRSTR